jgi:hypothetical protein
MNLREPTGVEGGKHFEFETIPMDGFKLEMRKLEAWVVSQFAFCGAGVPPAYLCRRDACTTN